MKLHPVTIITAVVTLALAQRAAADGFAGTTTEFSKVSVALTVETNKPEIETSSAIEDSTGKAKIDSVTVLRLAIASGANTNEWRTNAQLIFDWSTYQMAVADKTGSNILAYLASGGGGVSNDTTSAFFDVDWFNNFDNTGVWDFSALKDKRATTSPGTDSFTSVSEGYFELSYSDSSNTNADIDIFGYGPNQEHYIQYWDVDSAPTKWADTEKFSPSGAGKKEIVNGTPRAAVTGSINANGTGPGNNTYIYPL